jgi:hypothetical protein
MQHRQQELLLQLLLLQLFAASQLQLLQQSQT